jgi:hypothetical protein
MTMEAREATEKMTKGKITRTNDIVAIARAAYEAYVAKNRAAIEKLIAADFHFTSPLDNRISWAGLEVVGTVQQNARPFGTFWQHLAFEQILARDQPLGAGDNFMPRKQVGFF